MKKRVLVVEDEEKLRRVVELQLVSAGFEVDKAATAEEGVKVVDRADLVLTDLRLPNMDGLGLLALIRRQNAQVPVVVMTAYGSIETAVECMKAGATDFLLKPFSLDHLMQVVHKALEVRALRDSGADEHRRRRGEARDQGCDRKEQKTGHEHLAPAEQVAHPAAEQQKAAEQDRVRRDDPLQALLAEVEVGLDRRQGDVDDGDAEHDHELGGDDDRQRGPAPPAFLRPDSDACESAHLVSSRLRSSPFEAAWAGGQRPKLESFLARTSGSNQQELLRELLVIEIHYRRRLGETPTVREYG